jgi:hypothetical protein
VACLSPYLMTVVFPDLPLYHTDLVPYSWMGFTPGNKQFSLQLNYVEINAFRTTSRPLRCWLFEVVARLNSVVETAP